MKANQRPDPCGFKLDHGRPHDPRMSWDHQEQARDPSLVMAVLVVAVIGGALLLGWWWL
jgi:hypothetical protein